jgi:hypothetical protein
MTALAIVLIVAGAVLELAGIAMIALQIRSDQQRARELVGEPLEPPGVTVPVGRSLTLPYDVEGRQPTLEERVERVEADVAHMRQDLLARTQELQENLGSSILGAADKLERQAQIRDEALRDLLRDVLTGDLGRRRLGVAFVLVGLVVATAGNLVSLAA